MKKYIITDPGYIMSGENWEKYCQALEDSNQNAPACNALLSELLGVPAMADRTGYGDWGNVLNCEEGEDHVLREEFCADAGMVCCCEFTPEMEAVIKEKKIGRWCYAILEAETPVFEISRKDPCWTMVKVTDGDSVYSTLTRKEAALLELI